MTSLRPSFWADGVSWLTAALHAAACALLSVACAADGTKTGNGVQMEFVASGASLTDSDVHASTLVVTDLQGTTFLVDEALLIVSQVELRAKGEDLCSFELSDSINCTNGRLRFSETMQLDLLGPRTNERLMSLAFPEVTYDRVEVRTQALAKDSALGPVSFYVAGQVTLDGSARPFVLSLKRNETLRFENSVGVDVASGQWLSAQIDLSAWFGKLPLTSCIEAGEVALEGDTWMFTEDSKCKEIERLFVEELRLATRLSRSER